MKNKTSLHIGGMWFHITWDNEKIGYDQRGTKWINKKSPECTNKEIIDIALQSYISKETKKHLF